MYFTSEIRSTNLIRRGALCHDAAGRHLCQQQTSRQVEDYLKSDREWKSVYLRNEGQMIWTVKSAVTRLVVCLSVICSAGSLIILTYKGNKTLYTVNTCMQLSQEALIWGFVSRLTSVWKVFTKFVWKVNYFKLEHIIVSTAFSLCS